MLRLGREVTGLLLLLAAGMVVDVGQRFPVAAIAPVEGPNLGVMMNVFFVMGVLAGSGLADKVGTRAPLIVGIAFWLVGRAAEMGDRVVAMFCCVPAEGLVSVGSLVVAAELVTGDPDAPRKNRFAAMAAFLFARHGLGSVANLLPMTFTPRPVIVLGALGLALGLAALIPRRLAAAPAKMPALSPYRAAPVRLPKPMPSVAELAPLAALILPAACLAAGSWAPLPPVTTMSFVTDVTAIAASTWGAIHFTRVARARGPQSPLPVYGLALVFGVVVWTIAPMNMHQVGIPQLTPVAAIAHGLMGPTAELAVGYVALSTRRASALPIAVWLIGESLLRLELRETLWTTPLAYVALTAIAAAVVYVFFRNVKTTQARFE